MNKITLALYNKIRSDSLIRTSDNVETLTRYVSRYFKHDLTMVEAESIFRALQTKEAKRKAALQAEKKELVELINS